GDVLNTQCGYDVRLEGGFGLDDGKLKSVFSTVSERGSVTLQERSPNWRGAVDCKAYEMALLWKPTLLLLLFWERVGTPTGPPQSRYDVDGGSFSALQQELAQQEYIYTKGCVGQFEKWLQENLIVVAGVFVGIALLQIFGICLAQNLVSDIKAVKANW
ncbi:hypothetical protein NFI96_032669, partial [Prochilodus magdalenae]